MPRVPGRSAFLTRDERPSVSPSRAAEPSGLPPLGRTGEERTVEERLDALEASVGALVAMVEHRAQTEQRDAVEAARAGLEDERALSALKELVAFAWRRWRVARRARSERRMRKDERS